MTDMKRLREIVNTQEAWIGLQSNPGQANRRWHWSLPGTQGVALSDLKTYFPGHEPTPGNSPENCARIVGGELLDTPCDINKTFICFNGTEEPPKSLICINESMNWTQAQNYCRENYTDLVSGLDQLAHLADYSKSHCSPESWIGLFRDTWSWSDGSNSSFRHWNLGLLKDGVNKECATVLKGEGKWDSAACDKKKPFVCYDGQCVSFTCHHIEYHLIEEPKTWDEAQRYCRENYTDLATVSDMTDMKRLREIVNTQEAWIGLQNNPGQANRRWHWSLPGMQGVALSELKTYFPGHEPTTGNSPENCARIVGGKLLDTLCGINKTFICFNGTEESPKSFIYIKESMNWTQAQNYCRDKYTDLVSGLDQLAHLADNTDRWIGLFRDTWSWSDGSNSSFRHWNLGLLKDGVNKECATVLKEKENGTLLPVMKKNPSSAMMVRLAKVCLDCFLQAVNQSKDPPESAVFIFLVYICFGEVY
uniref:C-type lectin domain-containing protein n=1 Tax=Labrus bergylta TaxID=56723 RepID=A0A3Q3FM70_9LABR